MLVDILGFDELFLLLGVSLLTLNLFDVAEFKSVLLIELGKLMMVAVDVISYIYKYIIFIIYNMYNVCNLYKYLVI